MPHRWAYVKFLYKKGPATNTTSYRPTSIGTVLARIVASHVREHLEHAFAESGIVHPAQCGFRADRSTWTAGLNIRAAIHRKREYHLLLVDVAKAFDNLDWVQLISFLEYVGVDRGTTDTIRNLYGNTRLCPSVLGYHPVAVPMTRGVRQGCVLSPLLWNVWSSM